VAHEVKTAAPLEISNVVRMQRRFDARVRRVFLDHLAATANVTKSAEKAGVSASTVYKRRRKDGEFRVQWLDALAEGYANLEASLLAEALEEARGDIPDIILKERAQRHRLALALLTAHRASVKALETKKGSGAAADLPGKQELREELISRLDIMRSRAESNSAK